MMNKNIFTKASALSAVLTILNSLEGEYFLANGEQIDVAQLTEKIEGMRETIVNKSSASKVNTAKVAEQEGVMNIISEVLGGESENENGFTIKEMQNASAELKELSNQKISAMLRKMIEAGTVTKEVVKKQAYFSLVTE